eukprot:gene12518-2283_t
MRPELRSELCQRLGTSRHAYVTALVLATPATCLACVPPPPRVPLVLWWSASAPALPRRPSPLRVARCLLFVHPCLPDTPAPWALEGERALRSGRKDEAAQ